MISLIVATYNSEKYISDCLNSILIQDYDFIETIIIDGLSTDKTLKLVNDFKSKMNIRIYSEKDNGIYDALNKGIKKANGDIIGFLHSDDILNSKSTISKIFEKINIGNLDGLYGDLNYVNKDDLKKIIRVWRSNDFNIKLLKKGWMCAHPTLFLKKEIYEEFGNFNVKYEISADYDFILRIFKNKFLKFGYLSKVITIMRVGGASNRSLINIIKKTKEDYRIIRSNNIGGFITLILKNTSKIKQFLK